MLKERADNGDSLLLPAGKPIRPFIEFFCNADTFKNAMNLQRFSAIGANHGAHSTDQRFPAQSAGHYISDHAQAWNKAKILMNKSDLTAQFTQMTGRQVGYLLALSHDTTVLRPHHSIQKPKKRGLS